MNNLNEADLKYCGLIKEILATGVETNNRTEISTLVIPHACISFNLAKGFPLLTTKKMGFRTIKVELEGFIKGITSKKWFQDRKCRIWDEWCNPQKVPYDHTPETQSKMLVEDDLGPIYGAQWRNFNGQGYDQLKVIVNTLKTNPSDRRMICSAWNPLALASQALPPCHYNFVVSAIKDTLHLSFSMRSVDVGLGLPFNIASYSLLCHLLAKEAQLKEGTVTGFLNNVHIYTNHINALQEQINRVPFASPSINTPRFTNIFDWTYEDTLLSADYQSHPSLPMPIAI